MQETKAKSTMFSKPKSTIKTYYRRNAARIGLISDTHLPGKSNIINPEIAEIFSGVDLILHAGDISTPEGLRQVNALADTIAVHGNHRGDRTLFNPPLEERVIIEVVNGIRLGLVHGMRNEYHHATDTILGRSGFVKLNTQRIVNRITPWFEGVHGIVFGHAHWPIVRYENEFLFINPGCSFGTTYASCGVLEIDDKEIRIKLSPLAKSGKFDPVLSRWHIFPLPTATPA